MLPKVFKSVEHHIEIFLYSSFPSTLPNTLPFQSHNVSQAKAEGKAPKAPKEPKEPKVKQEQKPKEVKVRHSIVYNDDYIVKNNCVDNGDVYYDQNVNISDKSHINNDNNENNTVNNDNQSYNIDHNIDKEIV